MMRGLGVWRSYLCERGAVKFYIRPASCRVYRDPDPFGLRHQAECHQKKIPLTRCKMGRGIGVLLDVKNNGILRGSRIWLVVLSCVENGPTNGGILSGEGGELSAHIKSWESTPPCGIAH